VGGKLIAQKMFSVKTALSETKPDSRLEEKVKIKDPED
jgi:hypothetical protein